MIAARSITGRRILCVLSAPDRRLSYPRLTLGAVADGNFIMGKPGADDTMLGYLPTLKMVLARLFWSAFSKYETMRNPKTADPDRNVSM